LLISNCLKKTNICGVDQEAWMLTLMVDCPFFVANVSMVCWICKYPNLKGQSASMMKKKNVKHPNLFRTSIVCVWFVVEFSKCCRFRLCNLQIFGVSRLQSIGFSRLQIVGLISNSLVLGFPICILLGLRLGFQFVDCWVGVGFLVCKLLNCGWVSNFQVYRLLGFSMFRLLHILGFQFANYWVWGWVFS